MAKNSNPFKNPQPFNIGNVIGTNDLKNISYTSFDFYAIKARTIEYIKKYFPDDYNDFVESDLGIMLVELWAYMADLISFKMDLNVNELFIDTVSQRKNIFRLAKLVGYTPRPPRPAVARIAASIPSAYAFDLKINRGYSISVSSRDGQLLNYQLFPADDTWTPIFDDDIIIPAGSVTNLSIIAIEGVAKNLRATSDGSRFQQYTSVETSVLEGSIEVFINNQKWTQVEFFDENNNGLYYRIEFDQEYRVTIFFADDIRGKIPPQGSNIVISYRVGGGERGNVDLGFINQIINVTSDIVPSVVPISINNYTKAEGGESSESIDEIKYKLPLYVKAQDRAVTGEDYSILAENYSTLYNGRIGKAKAILRNSGCSGNIIDIYVLQIESSNQLKTANTILKQLLHNYIESKKMLTDFICIKDASQIFQDINVNVNITKFNAQFKKDIFDRLKEKLQEFFQLTNWSIGQPLKKSDVIQYLNQIPNITSLDIELVENSQNLLDSTEEVVVDFWKIIRLGQYSININII